MSQSKVQLGTFSGVFMPSFLTIMGVIVFLRMGLVMGNAGLIQGLTIIVIANLVSLLTTLSVSAIATNLKVKGGGDYYLISRSLGIEYGGPIGLVLFLSQAVSVAFYIIGFSEVVVTIFEWIEPMRVLLECLVCALFFICASAELDWAARIQSWILVVLCLGLASLLIGTILKFDPLVLAQNKGPHYLPGFSFWAVFAIFFPAITGFTQGVSLSGDLKDPQKSIPSGTLGAVVSSFIIYVALSVLITGSSERGALLTNFMISKELAWVSVLIDLGVIGATLSSALTSFLGAPRILQALAQDNIFPFIKFFAKGYGPSNTPKRATLLTFVVALICILKGDLNTIAPIVTMFFLITYGLMNYATFVEGFGNNPSFRPRFKFFHWRLSLVGSILCLLIMLFINLPAALVALSLVALVNWLVDRVVKEKSWGDAQRGFYFSKIKDYLLRLRQEPYHAKNWRPKMLILCGKPTSRLKLVKLATWLEAGRGLQTLANILPGTDPSLYEEREKELQETKKFVIENDLPVFWEVLVSPSYIQGVDSLVQCHSIGGIKPNTVLMGWSDQKENQANFVDVIQKLKDMKKNIIIVDEEERLFNGDQHLQVLKDLRLDVWWRGEKNGSLMLLLAYLWTQNPECRKGTIRLCRSVASEKEQEKNKKELETIMHDSRIEAEVCVVVSTESWTKTIPKHSAEADVVFIGLSIPGEGGEEAFFKTYAPLNEALGTTVYVKSAEDLDVRV